MKTLADWINFFEFQSTESSEMLMTYRDIDPDKNNKVIQPKLYTKYIQMREDLKEI